MSAAYSSWNAIFILWCVLISSWLLQLVQGERTFRVVENSPTNFVLGRICNEGDGGSSCRFDNNNNICNTSFNIDSTSSIISVKNQSLLDREAMLDHLTNNILTCFVQCCQDNTLSVNIEILDENDETPRFSGLSQNHTIVESEHIAVGSATLLLQPVDNDNGRNGTTTFSITSGNEEEYFELRIPEMADNFTDRRELFVAKNLNYERVPKFQLEVTLRDDGVPPREFVQIIHIIVTSQDEAPTFETTSYTFGVPEDHPVGIDYPFANVSATTAQGGENIEYEMSNIHRTEIVGINPQTGGLYLRNRVDYETASLRTIRFSVSARNTNTQESVQTDVIVEVMDVANEPLYFRCLVTHISPCPTEINGSEFTMEENRDYGHSLLILEESDENSNFALSSSIIPEDAPLTITKPNIHNPYVISIAPNNGMALDRERYPVITVTLTTTINEAPFLQTLTTFRIRVLDKNDNRPEFVSMAYEGTVFEGSPVGRQILQVEATDADFGENGTVSYSITSVDKEEAKSWFEIDADTGVISVNSSNADYAAVNGLVTLTVTALDNGASAIPTSVPVSIRTVLSTLFSLNSYQQYSSESVNLLSATSQDIFLEFSPNHNGLLLYQQDLNGDAFSISYQDNVVIARLNGDSKNRTISERRKDGWMAIYVQKIQQQISSLYVGPTIPNSPLLQNLTVQSCSNGDSRNDPDHPPPLYIGGVNVFDLQDNVSVLATGFTGGIRNVVVGDIQLDMSCPNEQVNTRQGVPTGQGCSEISCTSSHSIGCVDLNPEPFCQCLGGFTAQACKISNDEDADTSYAPIRFTGNSGVKLNLGYTFFVDLQKGQRPKTVDATSAVNSRKRRNADDNSEDLQVVELTFRAVNLKDSVLLSSQTSSSSHIIEILESSNGNGSYLTYSILDHGNDAPSFDLNLNTPLENNTLYSLRAVLRRTEVTLELSGGNGSMSTTGVWESSELPEVPVFAKHPTTSIAIGSSLQSEDFSFFMGCITHFAIDKIEVPLNGLLTAGADQGGFEVNNTEGVDQFCDLCDLHVCSDKRHCVPGMQGEVSCPCNDPYVEMKGSCMIVLEVTEDSLNPILDNNTYYVIAGCALGGILFFGIFIILVIVMCRRRQEKKKAGRYSINNHISRSSRSRRDNNYNDHSPNIVKKNTSFTSSMNGNCTETHELQSSISTFQEHAEDADPESNSPLHKNVRGRRKSCTSVESGIKLDDRDMGTISARGIPTMEDSGHEVNSTDSNRTSESDEIASSCYNDQPQSRPSRPLARGSSPEHRMPHSPRTPLTPKEKKVMIPLRPPSTNLSQSEFDEEETIETESFHTRVSSSSGMGNSMQNQGRGSDTDSSKMSDSSRWYLPPSAGLDKDRDKIHLQTLRPYYQQHLGEPMQGACAYPTEIPPYPSPPTFTEHIDRNFRGRSKSLHNGKSPLSPNSHTSPPSRSYENYPRHFNGEVRGNGIIYKESSDLHYNGHQFHDRNLDTSRVSNDHDYTPSSVFSRQYSDPKIPRNGNYCIPRKHDEPWPIHNRQISDPQQSSQQTQDSSFLNEGGTRAPRHMNLYPSNSTAASSIRHPPVGGNRQFYTLGHNVPKHVNFAPSANQQAARSFSTGEAGAATNNEPYQTLNSLSKIDPISNWDAQDRMKIAVDHMDPCHLLSGPCIPFEYVSTDPSVVESQTTVDESIMGGGGSHQMFESQGGGEGMPNLLEHLDMNMVRLREDEIDSMLTDSEVGQHQVMNHFPSADCSSQYTATIVAGSTSTSGESTPKLQNVFVMPPSQQSFDV